MISNNKKMKFIIVALLALMIASIFIIALTLLLFTEQTMRVNINSLTCEEVKECILLDIACMESVAINNLFGMTWDVQNKYTSQQKDYYRTDCLNNDASKGDSE